MKTTTLLTNHHDAVAPRGETPTELIDEALRP
jgi:hypothetical protein